MVIEVPSTVQGLNKATVRRWHKQVGERVSVGEIVVELETEDAIVALHSAADGVLTRALVPAGTTVAAGAELGSLEAGGVSPTKTTSGAPPVSAAPAGGVPIMMPQAGNTMEEGTVLKWRVKVGDAVSVGQVICEVETDKATVEVEATAAGTIGWLAAEGSIIPVKQAIAMIGGGPTDASPMAAAPSPPTGPTVADGLAEIPRGVTPILMPQAGNTMEEGTIIKWRVKVGERITAGQIICEIETDKATVEMEATVSGRLAKIVSPEGAVVAVKLPIAYLAEEDGDVAGIGTMPAKNTAPAVPQKAPIAQAAAAPALGGRAAGLSTGGRVKASPAARKLAAEKGIDLGSVGTGSGPEGRILSTDLAAIRLIARPAAAAPAPSTSPTPARASVQKMKAAGPMAALSGGRKPLSKMRKAIATNLQISKQTVPHFYVKLTINADPLFAFYRAHKPATGCTLNDVILLAVGRIVGEMGAFRSRLEGSDIVEVPAANIGVAVSVPDGLVVPVVLNVHALTLAQLAGEARRVVESARNGKIDNMGKGVFTISNMGMLGVEDFSAIINPPESGILAISGVRESVIVKEGAMRAARVMSLTLSVDHRVVDGAVAAGFMGRLRELLESPDQLLG